MKNIKFNQLTFIINYYPHIFRSYYIKNIFLVVYG